MKLTKYGHACFTLEKDGSILVIDPGTLSDDFVVNDAIVGIVITHAHPDHFDPETLAKIYDKNPDSLLLSTAEVVEKMVDHNSEVAEPGSSITIGPFTLEFFGGNHAVIHDSVPVIDNIGVMINDAVFYPGDSFVMPGRPVSALAIPLGAPWLKVSEAIDFMTNVAPTMAFPTHDAVLSDAGKSFHDSWLQRFAEPANIDYRRVNGQTIDIT